MRGDACPGRFNAAFVMSERKLATLVNGVATIEGIAMTTYRVTGGRRSVPRRRRRWYATNGEKKRCPFR